MAAGAISTSSAPSGVGSRVLRVRGFLVPVFSFLLRGLVVFRSLLVAVGSSADSVSPSFASFRCLVVLRLFLVAVGASVSPSVTTVSFFFRDLVGLLSVVVFTGESGGTNNSFASSSASRSAG